MIPPTDPSETFRCPTCGARQLPAAECRRCKCDLSLVVAARGRQQALHAECLEHLRSGQHAESLRAARDLWALAPDEDAARLLAVCYLVLGRFRAALDVYDTLGSASARR